MKIDTATLTKLTAAADRQAPRSGGGDDAAFGKLLDEVSKVSRADRSASSRHAERPADADARETRDDGKVRADIRPFSQ